MFAYLAGCTNLSFATSILIGPQRQTALLAKQAAELDLLCGGRLRLGIGIGWNKLEYDALGVPFEQRAAILEEQIAVLRALWTTESVTLEGRLPPHDGVRPRPAPGTAPDPDLARRLRPSRLAAGRAGGRRMVPDARARTVGSKRHWSWYTKGRSRPAVTCRGFSSRGDSSTASGTTTPSPSTHGVG